MNTSLIAPDLKLSSPCHLELIFSKYNHVTEFFVESEDDYGDTRLDRLNGIESYEDRIGALGKLTNSFREASAGKPGRKPVINKAAEKRAKEAEDSYAELNKKVDAGDYNNVGDMTNDFFAAIAKEIEGIA